MPHAETEIDAMYRALERELKARKAFVESVPPLCSFEAETGGYFWKIGGDDEFLYGVKVFHRDPRNRTEELVSLAHEAGHCESCEKGLHPDAYTEIADRLKGIDAVAEDQETVTEERKKAIRGGVTDKEKNVVLAEEKRAWDFAKATLKRLGSFEAWDLFGRLKSKGLASYRGE